MPTDPSCSEQTQPRRWRPQQRPPKSPWQPARCESSRDAPCAPRARHLKPPPRASLRNVAASRRADCHQRAIPIRLANLNSVNEILLTLDMNSLHGPGQLGIQRHEIQPPALKIAVKIN